MAGEDKKRTISIKLNQDSQLGNNGEKKQIKKKENHDYTSIEDRIEVQPVQSKRIISSPGIKRVDEPVNSKEHGIYIVKKEESKSTALPEEKDSALHSLNDKPLSDIKVEKQTFQEVNKKEQSQDIQPPLPEKIISFEQRLQERKKNEEPFCDDGNREHAPSLPYKRKKKKNRDINKVPLMAIIAVFSAIIVGISFGVVVKMMFTGDSHAAIDVSEPELVSSESQEVMAPISTEPTWPIFQLEVVQAGAFHSLEKGDEMANQITEEGFPAVLIPHSDQFFLLIGSSSERENADTLSGIFSEHHIDTYVKSFQVGGNHSSLSEESLGWFQEAGKLLQKIAILSSTGLVENVDLPETNLEEIKSSAEILSENRDSAFENLPEEQVEQALQLADQIQMALVEFSSYQDNNEHVHLWNVQQTLLTILKQYQAITLE
ncbi:hypothetical protein [Alkalihalobacillus trypoxylicola]|uniref:SPOR domain-containing protein n=1 Tax=Alkalihalobacillus trypoxylicola TaxID=519424 RepID=A0A161Q759_9BACI|nr:hypothetical protein [Alkalihalobacillus trypoxylicola]KYG32308.1 hypothetical protein AZF04_05960 [Alkalihalobacillus trypoxylicola]